MVATSDLGSDAERRGGSSPFVRTRFLKTSNSSCSFFFVPCADKVPRTSCSASGDLSAVGSDVLRCNATMGMRREQLPMQASSYSQPILTIYDCQHIPPCLGHLSASADVRVPRGTYPKVLRQSISLCSCSADHSSNCIKFLFQTNICFYPDII